MSVRLSLALEAGGFHLPETGSVFVFHPSMDADLSALPKERVKVIQPLRPAYERFASFGYDCAPVWDGEGRASASVVFVTRAKAQTRDLIAQACAATDGPVLIDGAKNEGIDSFLKDLRKLCDPSRPISKAHGKIFGIEGGAELPDWRATEDMLVDGYKTAPGVFSADEVDPASRILVEALPHKLGRRVADLGAGWGYLSGQVLLRDTVDTIHLVEADSIALECARRNVSDPRAQFHWADATTWTPAEPCDAVVMNPPFHTGRAAEPALGQSFIRTAAKILTPGGQVWMVANRHLPYETTLEHCFAKVAEIAGNNRFKVLHAQRPRRSKV